MTTSAESILAQLRGQRRAWIDMPMPAPSPVVDRADETESNAKPAAIPRLHIDTPTPQTLSRLLVAVRSGDEEAVSIVSRLVVGWSGITSAIVLGDAVGGQDEIEFSGESSPPILDVLFEDRGGWFETAMSRVLELAKANQQRRAAASGN